LPFTPDAKGFLEPGFERHVLNDCWGNDSAAVYVRRNASKVAGIRSNTLFAWKDAPCNGIYCIGIVRIKVASTIASVESYILVGGQLLAEMLPI
jgi:hypothetical protein